MMAATKPDAEVWSAETSQAGTLIVLAHLAALMGHGAGHAHLGIGTSSWQNAFIALVIFIAPFVAMVLLWTRAQKAGVVLLGSAMTGAFVFGLYYHFVAPGADNALGVGPGGWSTMFLITAALLALIEAMGAGWCVWTVSRTQKPGVRASQIKPCS